MSYASKHPLYAIRDTYINEYWRIASDKDYRIQIKCDKPSVNRLKANTNNKVFIFLSVSLNQHSMFTSCYSCYDKIIRKSALKIHSYQDLQIKPGMFTGLNPLPHRIKLKMTYMDSIKPNQLSV